MSTPQMPGTDSGKLDSTRIARGAEAPDVSATISKAALKKEVLDDVDARAREVEQQMTDDERFSLIISVMGYIPGSAVGARDPRIPKDLNMSAGYTPGVPRLGIPVIQSSDASMGVTNPGYRPDDKGATAFPSLIALGSSFNPDSCAKVVKQLRARRAFADSTCSLLVAATWRAIHATAATSSTFLKILT